MQEANTEITGVKMLYNAPATVMQLDNLTGYLRLVNNVGAFTWYVSGPKGWKWLVDDTARMAAIEALYQEKLVEVAASETAE